MRQDAVRMRMVCRHQMKGGWRCYGMNCNEGSIPPSTKNQAAENGSLRTSFQRQGRYAALPIGTGQLLQ